MTTPFDAVFVISFGGPLGPADIRPFLFNVLGGRHVPPDRIEEAASHYELFGGVSPLTGITMRQAEGLRTRLAAAGQPLPVHVGMRNWKPFIADALADMSRAGIRRAVGFITAAHRTDASCAAYKTAVADGRAALRAAGLSDVEVTYVPGWHTHPGFIETNAAHVRDALERLPAGVRAGARLIFTAHSIPTASAERTTYREQILESAELVAARSGCAEWRLAYQSRSGRKSDSWLGPDIREALRQAAREGEPAAVVCPIGFLCDHVEVLYDLDREAAAVARDVSLPFARAETVNDDPRFLDAMADVVLGTVRRYASGRPLPW